MFGAFNLQKVSYRIETSGLALFNAGMCSCYTGALSEKEKQSEEENSDFLQCTCLQSCQGPDQ